LPEKLSPLEPAPEHFADDPPGKPCGISQLPEKLLKPTFDIVIGIFICHNFMTPDNINYSSRPHKITQKYLIAPLKSLIKQFQGTYLQEFFHWYTFIARKQNLYGIEFFREGSHA
jgi:hypothetical protein